MGSTAAPPHALRYPCHKQLRQRLSDAAGGRTQGEDQNSSTEGRSCAIAVGDPTAERNEYRKAEKIGRDGKIDVQRVRFQLLGHGRQRRGND
jgi:hypothetical protein